MLNVTDVVKTQYNVIKYMYTMQYNDTTIDETIHSILLCIEITYD